MKYFKKKIKIVSTTALFCLSMVVVTVTLLFGVRYAAAEWEEPSATAPGGNIYVPLNIGPEDQAKSGGLLLNPLYNPGGTMPSVSKPLEVRGPNNTYINKLDIATGGTITVDTDTLYVNDADSMVGIGTVDPTALLDVRDGGVSVGSTANPITVSLPAVYAVSDTSYGVYGESTAVDTASIRGVGSDSSGVYGLNTTTGYGIFADSITSSAVVGTANSSFDPAASIKAAGIFASARGLGAWAGYLAQRLYGSEDIIGTKFTPSRLENSQIPYVAGTKLREIGSSRLIDGKYIAFDGEDLWLSAGSSDWNNSRVYVVDPDTFEIKREFDLGADRNHGFEKLEYAGGYVWLAHYRSDEPIVEGVPMITRFTPNSDPAQISYDQYLAGTEYGDNIYSSAAIDFTYDDVTTPGTPYLWIINVINHNRDYYTYSISRMETDGTNLITFKLDPPAGNGGKMCEIYDQGQCMDNLDNDGDGNIDEHGMCQNSGAGYDNSTDCAANSGTWSPAVCSDLFCDNQTDCEGAGAGQCSADWGVGVCSARTYVDSASCSAAGAIWSGSTCRNTTCNDQTECTTCVGAPLTWDDTTGCGGDPNCLSEATCEQTVICGGTWVAPDLDCPFGELGTHKTDERIVEAEIGNPSGITFDGEYVWITFEGSADSTDNSYAAGEAYARFLASDPEESTTQYTYCTGPATAPTDIVYDYINDWIWAIYTHRDPDTNRGLYKIDASNGAELDKYIHLYDTSWNLEHQIEFFGETPGGPSLWVTGNSRLHKTDPLDPETIVNTYISAGMHSMTFGTRDPDNPIVWVATGGLGAVLKGTMEPTYTMSSNTILGAGVDKLLFDGAYIWAAHEATAVGKYRSRDGVKIGEFDIGVSPENMLFDGASLWFASGTAGNDLIEVDPADGTVIDRYSSDIDARYTGDVLFDGKNIWGTRHGQSTDNLYRVNTTSCASGTCADAEDITFPVNRPNLMAYDGDALWVTHDERNIISRVIDNSPSPMDVTATLTLAPVSTQKPYGHDILDSIEYDGTYLWIGTYYVDGDGNSVYKIDPRGYDVDDGYAGVCSNDPTISCNYNVDAADPTHECGAENTCNALIAGAYPIYHIAGTCSHDSSVCMKDADCGTGNTCDGMWSDVHSLTFDGTNIWASNRAGIKFPKTAGVCADGIDNDGNGQCDYDGAAGFPGCSGKPDPGCESATGEREGANYGGVYNTPHLSRIVASTGEIIESVKVGYGCFTTDSVFDGSHIWLGADKACFGDGFGYYTLAQYYAGSGLGLTDLASAGTLYSRPIAPADIQSGSFSTAGTANFGTNLTVIGDLVVNTNVWGGASDNLRDFGTGCDDGEFVKGLNTVSKELQCRPL